MSVTIKERLVYKGEEFGMATEPLAPYLKNKVNGPKWKALHTACRRGYIGKWEIIQDKLYLIDLRGQIKKDNEILEVGLDYLFPKDRPVFAKWYSGSIRVPYGKMIEYIHAGYYSRFEKEFFLEIEEGIQIGYRHKVNFP